MLQQYREGKLDALKKESVGGHVVIRRAAATTSTA